MAMSLLDLGIVKYYKLVANKQKNVYINACSDVGRVFLGRGGCGCTKVLFPIKLFLELAMGVCKVGGLLELFKSYKFAGQYR